MNKKYLRDLMNNDLSPLIKDTGIEFYDVEYSNNNGKNILTFYIEKDDGLISIDDCELINNKISDRWNRSYFRSLLFRNSISRYYHTIY